MDERKSKPETGQQPVPAAFTVEHRHLREMKVSLALAGITHRLVLMLAAEHGIEDPEEEWILEASGQLHARIEEALVYEACESPAEWKRQEALLDERSAEIREGLEALLERGGEA